MQFITFLNPDCAFFTKGGTKLSREQAGSTVLTETKQDPRTGEPYVNLEKLEVGETCKTIAREEKIKEAGKPLYLMRYE